MQLCKGKRIEFAGSGCFKTNRYAGLTSVGEDNSVQINNEMARFKVLGLCLFQVGSFGKTVQMWWLDSSLLIWWLCCFGIEVHLGKVVSGREARNRRHFWYNLVRYLQHKRSTCMLRWKCMYTYYKVKKDLDTNRSSGLRCTKSIVPLV